MTISEELDLLHSRFPSCGTLAYADLAAQMVLVTSSQSPLDRHSLDALCASAARLLGAGEPLPLGTLPAAYALTSEPGKLLLFLRPPGASADALLCHADQTLDLALFQAEAQACLGRISEET
jgi:hypothetical protein